MKPNKKYRQTSVRYSACSDWSETERCNVTIAVQLSFKTRHYDIQVSREGLKLCGSYQLGRRRLLGEDKQSVKNSTDDISVANKEINLEVNSERNFVSREQNAEQHRIT